MLRPAFGQDGSDKMEFTWFNTHCNIVDPSVNTTVTFIVLPASSFSTMNSKSEIKSTLLDQCNFHLCPLCNVIRLYGITVCCLSTGPVEDYSLNCQQAIHVGTLAACLECRCKACGRSWSTGPQHIISLNSTLASCCPWDTVYAVCSFTVLTVP